MSSRVTVQLDGRAVRNLHLLVFGLRNSGHRAIAAGDFERHLTISFGEGQIVSAEVSSQLPSNIDARISISESRIHLQPLLLNPGDQLLIQVLLSAARPTSSVDVRILDISALAPINCRPRLPPFLQSGLPTMIIVFLIIGIGNLVFNEVKVFAYAFLGLAVFIPIFSLVSRATNDFGRAARRRISEV